MRAFLGLALVAALAATGCRSTVAEALASKSEGVADVYAAPVEALWPATIDVLRANGAGLIEEHRAEGNLVTEFAGGGIAAVWFDQAEGGTKVTALTLRYYSMAVTKPLLEETFHRELRAKVGNGP